MKTALQTYWNETVAEIEKVTWPSKDELVGSTIVTIVVSISPDIDNIVAIVPGITLQIFIPWQHACQ